MARSPGTCASAATHAPNAHSQSCAVRRMTAAAGCSRQLRHRPPSVERARSRAAAVHRPALASARSRRRDRHRTQAQAGQPNRKSSGGNGNVQCIPTVARGIYANCSTIHAACSTLHGTCSMHPAACNTQHATAARVSASSPQRRAGRQEAKGRSPAGRLLASVPRQCACMRG